MNAVEEAKATERAAYTAGNYPWLAAVLMPAAEDLVRAAGVGPGDRVLDVAAGTGNVAVAAARRGASVTAVDLTPRQVERGEARTRAEGLDVTWMVGDAEALPVADGAYTHVLSAFGVMYAPQREVAAAELRRAATPDGVIGVVAWPPGGFNDRLGDVICAMLGIPVEGDRPSDWGDASAVSGILGDSVRCTTGVVAMEAPSPEAMTEAAAANIGFMVMLREGAPDDTYQEAVRAYREIVEDCAGPGPEGMLLELPYTCVTVGARPA